MRRKGELEAGRLENRRKAGPEDNARPGKQRTRSLAELSQPRRKAGAADSDEDEDDVPLRSLPALKRNKGPVEAAPSKAQNGAAVEGQQPAADGQANAPPTSHTPAEPPPAAPAAKGGQKGSSSAKVKKVAGKPASAAQADSEAMLAVEKSTATTETATQSAGQQKTAQMPPAAAEADADRIAGQQRTSSSAKAASASRQASRASTPKGTPTPRTSDGGDVQRKAPPAAPSGPATEAEAVPAAECPAASQPEGARQRAKAVQSSQEPAAKASQPKHSSRSAPGAGEARVGPSPGTQPGPSADQASNRKEVARAGGQAAKVKPLAGDATVAEEPVRPSASAGAEAPERLALGGESARQQPSETRAAAQATSLLPATAAVRSAAAGGAASPTSALPASNGRTCQACTGHHAHRRWQCVLSFLAPTPSEPRAVCCAADGVAVDIVEQLSSLSGVAVPVEMEVAVRQVARHPSEVQPPPTARATVTRVGQGASVVSAAPALLGTIPDNDEEAIAHDQEEVGPPQHLLHVASIEGCPTALVHASMCKVGLMYVV